MKKICVRSLLLIAIFLTKNSFAQQEKKLSKDYTTVSVFYPAPDNSQHHFADIYFRLAWNNKTPYKIAIQFLNTGYKSQKLKFAIKDTTSKKMVILDTTHNSHFELETVDSSAQGSVWSGLIDNIKDDFSVYLWDDGGDEFNNTPISVNSAEVPN